MMDLTITSTDPLVFRDGRPFGDAGHVNGGALRWPWPSTISGVIRSRVGEGRDPEFFTGAQRQANITAIKKLYCLTLPIWQQAGGISWQPLFPAPADALLMPGNQPDQLRVLGFAYEDANRHGGTDLPWAGWLLPATDETAKPARNFPGLWFQQPFFQWLERGRLDGDTIPFQQLGLAWPHLEFRMHNAIDPITGTVSQGRLFSTQGIRLESGGNQALAGLFAIGARVENLLPEDDPTGPCPFGGERKIAHIMEESGNRLFPPCPSWFDGKKFLRLILASPGKFASWAPDWLSPMADQSFRPVPGTNIKVRMRGAHVPRWSAISGWDFELHGPKAFSKLVPAGSVYLLELENQEESQAVANHLWGKTLTGDPDGFGLTYIGNLCIQGAE